MKYMVDGNVIDYLIDNNVDVAAARTVGTMYIASVQQSELRNTPDETRRDALAAALDQLSPILIPVMTPVWLDEMHWDDNAVWRDHPSEVESTIYGNSQNVNNWKDATIGGAAQEKGCVLVSSDSPFRNRAGRANIQSISPEDLFGRFAKN